MGRKIFVSYKYRDTNVQSITNFYGVSNNITTVRDYVDKIESFCDKTDHIYKAERDNEDLSQLSDEEIWERLKDRIYDTSITIVLISPAMKETGVKERNQWIPWEIAYSLREVTRDGRTSASNAILAVVLPDSQGNYEYYITQNDCCNSGCRSLATYKLFYILRKNMYNLCSCTIKNCQRGSKIYYGDSSYIQSVKWDNFKNAPNYYIEKAIELQNNMRNYEITKGVGDE